MQNVTTGVAMPSLRPLSTFSTRRTRTGRRSSAITDALSAASVGARLAAISPARASGRLGNRTTATAVPARIDSGSPMASSRAVRGRSRRAAAGGTPEASPNSNRASVSSASAWTVWPSMSMLPIPQSELARSNPATMNTSGPVRSWRANQSDRIAHPKITAASAARAVSFIGRNPPVGGRPPQSSPAPCVSPTSARFEYAAPRLSKTAKFIPSSS